MRNLQRVVAAVLLAWGVLIAGHSAWAQPPATADPAEWSLPAYVERLAQWQVIAAADGTSAEQFARLRDDLTVARRVTVGGWSITSPPRHLVVLARAAASTPRDAQARQALAIALADLRDDAAMVASVPAVPRLDGARTALADILARDEFKNATTRSWLDQWIERFERWLAAQIMRLLGATGDHPWVRSLLSWATVGAALLALSVLAWRVLRTTVPPPARSRAAPGPVLARGESWESWLDDASHAARDGDARECLRAAHWAAVHRLQELGAWRLAPSRTPREYLRALPSTHAAHDAFRQLSERFERAWYGRAFVSPADVDAVFRLLEQLGCHRPAPPTGRS